MDSSTATLLLRLILVFVGGAFVAAGSDVGACCGVEGFVMLEGLERVDSSDPTCCGVEWGTGVAGAGSPTIFSSGVGKGDELKSDLDWGTVAPDASSLSTADSIMF